MKSKITSFLMSLMTILLLGVLVFLGIIIYNEFANKSIVSDVKEFISNITISSESPDKNVNMPEKIEIIDNELDESNVLNENIDYNRRKGYRYFFEQLDEYSKIIYNALDENKQNMKIGTYEVDLGSAFSSLLSQNDGDKLLGDYYQSAIEAFSYDNPDVFYIEYLKLSLNIETTTRGYKTTYRVFLNSGDSENYLTDEFSSKEKIDNALDDIEKVKSYFVQNRKIDAYQNIKLVHDYLIDSIEYEQSTSKSNIYNLYGALINKECVCEGYAKAYKYLMDSLDLPCIIVVGKATNSEGDTENHAWNYVQLNGVWYGVDCTWDDPILEGIGYISDATKHKYFLKGQSEFNKTHIPNGQFTKDGKLFKFPELSINNF